MMKPEVTSMLEDIKRNIDSAKSEKSKVEGRLEEGFATLERDYGVKSLEEAEELASKMTEELEDTKNNLKNMVTNLQERFTWISEKKLTD